MDSMKNDTEKFIRLFSVWLIATFFFALIGVIRWDATPTSVLLFAAFLGFKALMQTKFYMIDDSNIVTIETKTSPDGIVVATLVEWADSKIPNEKYRCEVKRNYQTAVFHKEQSFADFIEAKVWLKYTYLQECEKHLQHP